MKKYIVLIPVFLATFLLTGIVTFADEVEVFDVDPFSGETVTANMDDQAENSSGSGFIYITPYCTYDLSSENFRYSTIDGTLQVISSVADGMVTTEPVHLEIPENYSVQLYRNSVPYEGDINSISQVGRYVLTTDTDSSQRIFSFTIVSSVTGMVTSYTMPDGFMIVNAMINGEPAAHTNYSIDFSDEGRYVVNYVCQASEVSYRLNIQTDFTAPKNSRLAAIADTSVFAEVDITPEEEGNTVSVVRNGTAITPVNPLNESGIYTVTYTDMAGNSTSYTFTIRLHFNTQTWIFLVVIILMLIALTLYLYRSSRKMRVR